MEAINQAHTHNACCAESRTTHLYCTCNRSNLARRAASINRTKLLMSHMGLTHDSKPSKLRLETGRVSGQVMREGGD